MNKGYIRVVAVAMMASILGSCWKEDMPVQLEPPGEAMYSLVGMGEDYHRQVYFDLGTADTLGSDFASWDLCFEASDSGWHIWINGGKEALVANMDTQDFDAITDTAGAHWLMDDPEWNIDSTALGDWRMMREVHIIDRGPATTSADRFRKLIFQSVDDEFYELQFSHLDGSGLTIFEIPKKPNQAFVYFTFDNGGQMLEIEPDIFRWDILFTRYRTVFYSVTPPLAYLVTGVLTNPGLQVAVDSSTDFSSIDYQKALSYDYSSRRDAIGYNWKYFDFAAQAYVVKPYINYIIRDMEGVYWKLRFIDFYNSDGQKGYPQMEYQRL